MEQFWQDLGRSIPGLLAVVFGLAIIGMAWYFSNRRREMAHRERMLALEKGLQPPAEPNHAGPFARGQLRPSDCLLRGLIWFFVGLGLFGFLVVFSADLDAKFRSFTGFLAVIPFTVGLAYLAFYVIEGRKSRPPAP